MIRPAALCLAIALALPVPAGAGEAPVLTLSGNIAESTPGPSQLEDATLFGAHDIWFERGFAMTRATLAAMPQVERAGTVSGSTRPVTWSGPRLMAVLEAAGAGGETVLLTAIDGYTLEIPMAEIRAHDPILAISVDGAALALGDQGPAVVVWPAGADDDQRQRFADWQIWALYHIGVK